jgi:hypothetical protein
MATDRDSRGRTSKREDERDPRAAHDAIAQVAWAQGYLYGIGRPNIARALARKRSMEAIRQRRTALDDARALRNLKRILTSASR